MDLCNVIIFWKCKSHCMALMSLSLMSVICSDLIDMTHRRHPFLNPYSIFASPYLCGNNKDGGVTAPLEDSVSSENIKDAMVSKTPYTTIPRYVIHCTVFIVIFFKKKSGLGKHVANYYPMLFILFFVYFHCCVSCVSMCK